MYNITTLHSTNRSFVTVNTNTSMGRVVDFNRPNLPYSMQFTVDSIELEIENKAPIVYTLPISEYLIRNLSENMLRTQVCQYYTSGRDIVIRSRDQYGKVRCQFSGTLEADEKPLVIDGEVNLS